MKAKRHVDLDLVEYVKTLNCISCGGVGGDAHHVTTVGAGGPDEARNLMPLCRTCHTGVHKMGYAKSIQKNPGIKIWLESAGRHDILEKAKQRGTHGRS